MKDIEKQHAQDLEKEAGNDLVFSYLTLRNFIGIGGMLLPLVLVLFSRKEENERIFDRSISDYYYSSNGDVLVVLLSVLGVFLFTYRGYTLQEKILTSIAAISAIGIAFSPTATRGVNLFSIHIVNNKVPMIFGIERHFLFAAIFFIAISIMSLVYFPRTNKPSLVIDGRKTQKAKRNLVYKICGWVMVVCVVILGVYFIFKPDVGNFPVVFVFEVIAIEAFGLSWLTKGETLWPDKQEGLKL